MDCLCVSVGHRHPWCSYHGVGSRVDPEPGDWPYWQAQTVVEHDALSIVFEAPSPVR